MFNQNSIWAWVIILGLAVFILALNFGLLWGIKQKVKKDNWVNKVKDAGNILKNPMKKENEQLDALSEEILKIRKNESLPLIKTQPDPDNKEHE